ncbi:DUF4035 domain-containing protein [Nocardiopsis exhalans]|uniref:DUF4035 domain-containing protein n=1 Tax=Nocardiopsis exhalans TaxID=163604 RepID=A0ABY5D5U3_9ACTN|nr:DUF4035 domain-containing protein [Nocardiopsis exhalans]USY19729.1 DUF4035 domain-containing protein [Nocardiopsis exhalans]
MSSVELNEWMAYEQMAGPLGPVRQDVLFAQLCAVVANSQRDKKSRPAKPKDFLPKWEKRGPAQGWQQQKSVARMLNAAFGGTVNGKPTKPEQPPPRKPATRFQVRTQDHLYTVVDTTTGATEWTGLDQGQADTIAGRMNQN